MNILLKPNLTLGKAKLPTKKKMTLQVTLVMTVALVVVFFFFFATPHQAPYIPP